MASLPGFPGNRGLSPAGDLSNSDASFDLPSGDGSLPKFSLIISDTDNQVVRQIDSSGIITTLPLTSSDGLFDPGNFIPCGLAEDSKGNIYIADKGPGIITFPIIMPGFIWKFTPPSYVLTRVAGDGTTTFNAGALATGCGLNTPRWLTLDAADNLYVSLEQTGILAGINTQATPQVMFGVSIAPGVIDVIADRSSTSSPPGSFSAFPDGPCVDFVSGNMYVCDETRIFLIDPFGNITSVVGKGNTLLPAGNYSGDGGPAGSCTFPRAAHAFVHPPTGVLVFADFTNFAVRAANLTGSPQTLYGVTIGAGDVDRIAGAPPDITHLGQPGYSGDGGPATGALMEELDDVAYDSITGNLYISDTGNCVVRVVTPGGIINTFAGTGAEGYSGDGGPATNADFFFQECILLPRHSSAPPSGDLFQPNVCIPTS